MMKKILLLMIFSLFNVYSFSQVGINTDSPKATLDVSAKPADLARIDGIIAPRLTGNQLKAKDALYGSDQNGTFVFATSAASPTTAKTVEVTKVGYYYYDSALGKWIAFQSAGGSVATTNIISNPVNTITSTVNGVASSTSAVNTVANTVSAANQLTTRVNGVASTPVILKNIYNSDGTLTSPRTVTMAGYGLYLDDTDGDVVFRTPSIYQTATGNSVVHSLATGTGASLLQSIISGTQATISANGAANVLVIRTSNTDVSAPIVFNTSNGGGASAEHRAEIAGDGRFNIVRSLSIGYNAQQTFTGTQKLKINGSIVTTGNTYPDYVFQNYYEGSSGLNENYKFLNLKETEAFLQKNHHLPGVTSIHQLAKTEDGYEIDMSKLAVQTLEKVEELYLHIIEQQKQIDELKNKLEKKN